MESYSHGAFTVTGMVTHVPSHNDAKSFIPDQWKQWFADNTLSTIVGQIHPSMHAIYYNYNEDKTSFNMLIGVMTEEGVVQTNTNLTTLIIPAQDYRYVSVSGGFPDSIWKEWDKINHTSVEELPRSYGYDLEMYNEAGNECTIAVSVKE